jgi:hypothetical protein
MGDAAKQMVRRNVLFQVEGVEQWGLPGFLTSHHRVDFHLIDGKPVNQLQMTDTTGFFNGIDLKRTLEANASPSGVSGGASAMTLDWSVSLKSAGRPLAWSMLNVATQLFGSPNL